MLVEDPTGICSVRSELCKSSSRCWGWGRPPAGVIFLRVALIYCCDGLGTQTRQGLWWAQTPPPRTAGDLSGTQTEWPKTCHVQFVPISGLPTELSQEQKRTGIQHHKLVLPFCRITNLPRCPEQAAISFPFNASSAGQSKGWARSSRGLSGGTGKQQQVLWDGALCFPLPPATPTCANAFHAPCSGAGQLPELWSECSRQTIGLFCSARVQRTVLKSRSPPVTFGNPAVSNVAGIFSFPAEPNQPLPTRNWNLSLLPQCKWIFKIQIALTISSNLSSQWWH